MKTDLFINGAWQPSRSRNTFEVLNPATQTPIFSVASASREDVADAAAAATAAFPAWEALGYSERARFLLKAADLLESRIGEVAQTLIEESGSWIGKAMFETNYVVGALRAAAAAAYQVNGEILPSEGGKLSMVIRQPLGVVSVISPWNFPELLSCRGFAVAMAVGNCIVLKPSEETPYSGGLLFAELFEEVGLPAGVLNVVPCSREMVAEVGDEMVVNPSIKAISFTGSTAVGRLIAEKAGGLLKKACVELGGKDALIILDDADMNRAVNAATFGSFMHQGQICMSVERIIVLESVAEAFMKRFCAKAETLQTGDPTEMGKVIGPIINQKQLDRILDQISDAQSKGAVIHTGGIAEGSFLPATIISEVTPEMKIFYEETFGPVAIVIVASSVEEAIAIANDSEYGLSAGIITANEERGLDIAKQLHTGMAHINDSSVNDEPIVPFGGVKNSGLGRHGGSASIDTFTESRWITLQRGEKHYPPPFME